MTIHIDEVSTQVSMATGDVPLSDAQVRRLVEMVVKRLEEHERSERVRRQETGMRRQATSGVKVEE